MQNNSKGADSLPENQGNAEKIVQLLSGLDSGEQMAALNSYVGGLLLQVDPDNEWLFTADERRRARSILTEFECVIETCLDQRKGGAK